MSSDIKITRLPDDVNPDVLIRKTMKEKYAVCPYCGNKDYTEGIIYVVGNTHENKIIIDKEEWYGYPDGKMHGLIYIIKHRKELMDWKKYTYHCYKCGCRWESRSFPDEILTKEEVNEMGSLLNKK